MGSRNWYHLFCSAECQQPWISSLAYTGKEPSLPQMWEWGYGSRGKRHLGYSPDHCPYLCWKSERDIEIPGSSSLPHASRTPALWMLTSSRFGWSRREKCSFGAVKIYSIEQFCPCPRMIWPQEEYQISMMQRKIGVGNDKGTEIPNQNFLCASRFLSPTYLAFLGTW